MTGVSPHAALSARRALEERGYSSIVVGRTTGGTQAQISFIEAFDRQGCKVAFVLKAFTSRYAYNSIQAVVDEFSALTCFHGALQNAQLAARTPAPVALLKDEWAYLMTYEAGSPLDQVLLQASCSFAHLADVITRALKIYYDHVPLIYGDFQPLNLLVDASNQQVVFLDMTIPNPVYFTPDFRSLRYARAVSDLGFWVLHMTSQTPRMFVRQPRKWRAQRRFTKLLVHRAASLFAPGDEAEFVQEIGTVLSAHLRRWRGSSQVRGPLWTIVCQYITQDLLRANAVSPASR